MKDYSAMSDFEINKSVANYLGKTIQPDSCQDMGNAGFGDVIFQNGDSKDYCNNPADSWPIIFRERITLIPKVTGYEWDAISPVILNDDIEHLHTDKNPLRAAMIFFLMMKDMENSHA
ncbi:phage protein NinX family protein [Yersinia proxima]|uniref:phage protein NinX family protein n=1 Tax=Yersinia proxima TaxID=2890316 RepID=UPI001D103972|nr:phage protein NinX family protein [Yersinia proxima]